MGAVLENECVKAANTRAWRLPDPFRARSMERTMGPLRSGASRTSTKVEGGSKRCSVGWHAMRTGMWLAVAMGVAAGFGVVRGRERMLEFVAGYLVEYSLSVDNLFVFMVIFRYFNVPRESQECVLWYGIAGAMVLRGVMIVCGRALVRRFQWVGVGFAGLLIYSGWKLLMEGEEEEGGLEGNKVIRFARAIVPVGEKYCGGKFWGMEDGRFIASPLMVVLVAIELSDVVFALDSVPAVLGLSEDVMVVYVSNILAIMGLRSLFFVLASCIGSLRFLKQALAGVLLFIGVKMVAGCIGIDFGIGLSLGVVAVTLGGGVGLSLLMPIEEGEGPNIV